MFLQKNAVFVLLTLASMLVFLGCVSPGNSPKPLSSLFPSSLQLPNMSAEPSAPSSQAANASTPAPSAPAGTMHPWKPSSAAPSAPSGTLHAWQPSDNPADSSSVPSFPSDDGGTASASPSSLPALPSAPPSSSSNETALPLMPSGNGSQYGYNGGVPFGEITFPHPNSTDDPSASLPGSWRVYSSRLFYDVGGSGGMSGAGSSQALNLDPSGSWTYGSSSGTWSVASISSADWTDWKVNSYGPVYKIVLNNWNGGTADGPIEVTGTTADFLWVIYHMEPPLVSRAGSVQTKFGH